jgi:uncharacterized membrane protein
VLLGALAPLLLAALVGLVVLWPRGPLPAVADGLSGPREQYGATVLTARSQPCRGTTLAEGIICQSIEAELTSGPRAGTRVGLEQPRTRDAPVLVAGDAIILGFVAEAGEGEQYQILDYKRDRPMMVLAVLFVVAVLLLGRWKGVRALAGLVVSLGIVLLFILPAILAGSSPIVVALVGSALIAVVALYVAHGFNVATSVALLGTLASLALAGLLAWVFVGATRLTGLSSEEATLLQLGEGGAVNLQGLVLAGVILGTLGVLDDVTVTQVSAVWQLRRANPGWGAGELYRSALIVGRDHIASTVNTLVLAYAGASLPLLLLFRQADRPLSFVVTGEQLAIEIVRTLVGSIGLVASVPLTTLVAAVIAARVLHPDAVSEAHHH